MRFETKRLQIRGISPEDEGAILALLTDKTVAKTYMLPEFDTPEAAKPLFLRLLERSQDESSYTGGVYLDGAFIGMIHKTDLQDGQIEVGYAYLPQYYGQGYATEALRGAIDYLFSKGFSAVLAGAFQENPASMRVMEKCAMVRQAQTEQLQYRGVMRTCIYYKILKQ